MREPKHEVTDAHVRGLLWLGACVVVAIVVFHFGIGWFHSLLGRFYGTPVKAARVTGPTMEVPPPRLRPAEKLDWEKYQAASQETLQSYGWVDRPAGTIRIPIRRAMELTVQRGLPTRESKP